MRIYLKELLKLIDLDEIVEMISDLGISRSRSMLPTIGRASSQSSDTSRSHVNPIENEIGKTTDPVRMYMREMGTIELLG